MSDLEADVAEDHQKRCEMTDTERLLLIAPPLMNRTPAFDRAACLAKVKGACLHIVAFDYVEGVAEAALVNNEAIQEMRAGYMDRHHRWLEMQADGIRHSGAEVTTEVVWVAKPFDEILEHVRGINPTMVIKDLHHESWLSRAFFTSLDRRLLRDCPVEMHLVASVRHGIPRKILAAVDPFRLDDQFRHLNDQIITAALRLAEQCDAQLHVLHAYDLSYIHALDGGSGYRNAVMDELYEDQQRGFGFLADRYGVPTERRHFVTGSPARVIESFMNDHDIDVVVVGAVHRDLMNRLLGSTTAHLINHLPSSLLTVIPQTDETPRAQL